MQSGSQTWLVLECGFPKTASFKPYVADFRNVNLPKSL